MVLSSVKAASLRLLCPSLHPGWRPENPADGGLHCIVKSLARCGRLSATGQCSRTEGYRAVPPFESAAHAPASYRDGGESKRVDSPRQHVSRSLSLLSKGKFYPIS